MLGIQGVSFLNEAQGITGSCTLDCSSCYLLFIHIDSSHWANRFGLNWMHFQTRRRRRSCWIWPTNAHSLLFKKANLSGLIKHGSIITKPKSKSNNKQIILHTHDMPRGARGRERGSLCGSGTGQLASQFVPHVAELIGRILAIGNCNPTTSTATTKATRADKVIRFLC